MSHIHVANLRIPIITADQMKQVDSIAVEKYGIQIIQMMENAGRNLATTAKKLLEDSVLKKHLIIAVGNGNNGGGGLVAARHLHNWGAKITVLIPTETLSGIPEMQRKIIEKLPIEIKIGEKALQQLHSSNGQMILDALIGYGLNGKPRGWINSMIKKINSTEIQVLALDIPSGLDATSGEIYSQCIRASSTMTLALPKSGLVKADVKNVVGSLYLCDIGIPNVLYKEIGIEVGSIFIYDNIIKLDNIQEIA